MFDSRQENKETLGDTIKRIRIERKMEIVDLTKRAGLHTSSYRKIESNISRPRPDTIAKIARALNVRVRELLGEETKNI